MRIGDGQGMGQRSGEFQEKCKGPWKGWRGRERVGKGQGGMKRANEGWVGEARKS